MVIDFLLIASLRRTSIVFIIQIKSAVVRRRRPFGH